jgi:hypothetical protein
MTALAGAGHRLGGRDSDPDSDLQRAIAASMAGVGGGATATSGRGPVDSVAGSSALAAVGEDPELAAAIAMSLSQERANPAAAASAGTAAPAQPAAQLTVEELRAKRLARFDGPR